MNMQDATWGMYLDVRYFPYPKIRFSYLKIRQAVYFESLRSHAHFELLFAVHKSTYKQGFVEPKLRKSDFIPACGDVGSKEIYIWP